jgi:polyisoprenoid-binding protein YceI
MTTSLAPASLSLAAGSWVVDKTHSTVEFAVRHMGISKVRGTFSAFDARLDVAETLDATTLTARVILSSIDTNNAMRDGHLRNTDFFNVETHPEMTFVSRRITGTEDEGLLMTGELTLNGVTRTQAFTVAFEGIATFPFDGSTHAGFSANGKLSRKDFGIDFNVPLAAGGVVIGDTIDITLDIQLMPASEATSYHEKFLPAA